MAWRIGSGARTPNSSGACVRSFSNARGRIPDATRSSAQVSARRPPPSARGRRHRSDSRTGTVQSPAGGLEDMATARRNLRAFISRWPYEPEDLRDDTGPILVGCTLPRRQASCDVCSRAGVRAAGLPDSYPFEKDGRLAPHARCQPVGARVKAEGLRGVRARSAQSPDGAGREPAWFPASARSVARRVRTLAFTAWFRG